MIALHPSLQDRLAKLDEAALKLIHKQCQANKSDLGRCRMQSRKRRSELHIEGLALDLDEVVQANNSGLEAIMCGHLKEYSAVLKN